MIAGLASRHQTVRLQAFVTWPAMTGYMGPTLSPFLKVSQGLDLQNNDRPPPPMLAIGRRVDSRSTCDS
jgi:hypothetical protein